MTDITKSLCQPLLPMDLFDLYLTENTKDVTAIGSPVSVAMGNIAVQNIEEQALATYQTRLPFLPRYVDNTLTAVRKGQTEEVHKHLNKKKR